MLDLTKVESFQSDNKTKSHFTQNRVEKYTFQNSKIKNVSKVATNPAFKG